MLRKRIIIISIVICILSIGITNAESEKTIQDLIESNGGNVCTIPAGTYEISTPLEVPTGTTLQGELSSSGERLTKLILSTEYPIEKENHVITLSSNTKLLNLDINGNKDNRNVPMWKGANGKGQLSKNGQTYDILVYGNRIENIEIANCKFSNNAGDQIKLNYIKNLKIHDNIGIEAGHENAFIRQAEGVEIYNNYFQPSCNSAVRFILVSHARVYSNTVNYVTVPDGCGPGMQMQKTGGEMKDVEIVGNTFINTWGCGMWIAATDSNGEGELYIHHNIFLNSGKGGTLRDGAILGNGFSNVKIDNNVFDGSTKAGVYTYKYKSSWPSSGTFDINSNIFVDSDGYGILNEADHTIKTSNNCFWNNAKDTVNECSLSSSDFTNVNPRVSSTPSGWSWDGSKWSNPDVKVSPMENITGIYDNAPEITDEEMNELEYGNVVLDMYNMNFETQVNENDTIILPEGGGNQPSKALGKIEYYTVGKDNYTLVSVPSNGLSEVRYTVNGTTETHTLMIGERTSKGVLFTETSIWSGYLNHSGDALSLDGHVDSKNIDVECITPKGSFKPILEINTIEFTPMRIHPGIFILIGIVVFGIIEIRFILRRKA